MGKFGTFTKLLCDDQIGLSPSCVGVPILTSLKGQSRGERHSVKLVSDAGVEIRFHSAALSSSVPQV